MVNDPSTKKSLTVDGILELLYHLINYSVVYIKVDFHKP